MDQGKAPDHALAKTLLLFLALVYKVIIAYSETLVKLVTPARRKSIQGQNVLITGAGHGLGHELAKQFAQMGANLILVDINTTNNELVRKELQTKFKHLKIVTYSIDIRDELKVCQLAESVSKDIGDVDILVNNAGIVQCLPILELSPTLIERTFQVNVLAHFWLIKYFLPAMIRNQRGHIVAIASIAGLIGNKYLTDYCASKFAVVGLMDSLEREIHDKNANKDIHLTTVCPSSISTGMFKTFTSRFDWLLPVLDAQQVASRVMDSVLKNQSLVVLPPIALIFHRISSLIPTKVNYLVQEFLDYGVKPHSV